MEPNRHVAVASRRRRGNINFLDADARRHDAAQPVNYLERRPTDIIAARHQDLGARQFAGKIGPIPGLGQADLALGDEPRHVLLERTRFVIPRAVEHDDGTRHAVDLLATPSGCDRY